MLKSITIENFRCFNRLSTDQKLGTVNLILGMNNCGKTSLLEAIFLQAGYYNAGVASILNAIRGQQGAKFDPLDLWGWLFKNRQISNPIRISTRDHKERESILQIELKRASESIQGTLFENSSVEGGVDKVSDTFNAGDMGGELELCFTYQRAQDPAIIRSKSYLTTDGKLKTEHTELKTGITSIFISRKSSFDAGDAERFDALNKSKRKNEVIQYAKVVEPRLIDLTLSMEGKNLAVAGDIGLQEFVPISYMGEGFNRFLGIIVSMLSVPGGCVLIDEIEAGIHHSIMAKVWSAIGELARKQDTQVFATTHSWECLNSAHSVFSNQIGDSFRLLRLEQKDSISNIVSFSKQQLDILLSQELEVR